MRVVRKRIVQQKRTLKKDLLDFSCLLSDTVQVVYSSIWLKTQTVPGIEIVKWQTVKPKQEAKSFSKNCVIIHKINMEHEYFYQIVLYQLQH